MCWIETNSLRDLHCDWDDYEEAGVIYTYVHC